MDRTQQRPRSFRRPAFVMLASCLSADVELTWRCRCARGSRNISSGVGGCQGPPHLGVRAPERRNDPWCKRGRTLARGRRQDTAYAPRRPGTPPGSHLASVRVSGLRAEKLATSRSIPDAPAGSSRGFIQSPGTQDQGYWSFSARRQVGQCGDIETNRHRGEIP